MSEDEFPVRYHLHQVALAATGPAGECSHLLRDFDAWCAARQASTDALVRACEPHTQDSG